MKKSNKFLLTIIAMMTLSGCNLTFNVPSSSSPPASSHDGHDHSSHDEGSDSEHSGTEQGGGEHSGSEHSSSEHGGGENSGGETSGGETSGGETSGGENTGGNNGGGQTEPEGTYRVNSEYWLSALNTSNFVNATYTIIDQYSLSFNDFMTRKTTQTIAYVFDHKKVGLKIVEGVEQYYVDENYFLDPDITDGQQFLAQVLANLTDEYGPYQKVENNYIFTTSLESDIEYKYEIINDHFVEFYQQVSKNNYYKSQQVVDSIDIIYDYEYVFSSLLPLYKDAVYNEDCACYVIEKATPLAPHYEVLDAKVFFEHNSLQKIEYVFGYKNQNPHNSQPMTVLTISDIGNSSVSLPTVYKECKHVHNDDNYYGAESGHYQQCPLCQGAINFEPHHFVDGKCTKCDFVDTITEPYFIEGMSTPIGQLVRNAATNELYDFKFKYNGIGSGNNGDNIYIHENEQHLIRQGVRISESTLGPCYEERVFTYEILDRNYEIVGEPLVTAPRIHEAHNYRSNEYFKEDCHEYDHRICIDCNKESTIYLRTSHVLMIKEIDHANNIIHTECMECTEEISGIIEDLDYNEYVHFYRFNSFNPWVFYMQEVVEPHDLDENGICKVCHEEGIPLEEYALPEGINAKLYLTYDENGNARFIGAINFDYDPYSESYIYNNGEDTLTVSFDSFNQIVDGCDVVETANMIITHNDVIIATIPIIYEEYQDHDYVLDENGTEHLGDCKFRYRYVCENCGAVMSDIVQEQHEWVIKSQPQNNQALELECLKCHTIHTSSHFHFNFNEINHSISIYDMPHDYYYDEYDVHSYDEHGHCSICHHETDYAPLQLPDVASEKIYVSKNEDGSYSDYFLLTNDTRWDDGFTTWEENGVIYGIRRLSVDDEYVSDCLTIEHTTYEISVNGVVVAEFDTQNHYDHHYYVLSDTTALGHCTYHETMICSRCGDEHEFIGKYSHDFEITNIDLDTMSADAECKNCGDIITITNISFYDDYNDSHLIMGEFIDYDGELRYIYEHGDHEFNDQGVCIYCGYEDTNVYYPLPGNTGALLIAVYNENGQLSHIGSNNMNYDGGSWSYEEEDGTLVEVRLINYEWVDGDDCYNGYIFHYEILLNGEVVSSFDTDGRRYEHSYEFDTTYDENCERTDTSTCTECGATSVSKSQESHYWFAVSISSDNRTVTLMCPKCTTTIKAFVSYIYYDGDGDISEVLYLYYDFDSGYFVYSYASYASFLAGAASSAIHSHCPHCH